MKSHALAKSVGSQYGNQFNIAFRCSNLHTFLAKFVLRSVLQFVSMFQNVTFCKMELQPTCIASNRKLFGDFGRK